MFGGDEVGALVVDVGTYQTKIGFAGEGAPKMFYPSCAGLQQQREGGQKRYHVGSAALFRRDDMEMTYPVENGLVSDFDALEELWRHMFVDQMSVPTQEHPVMLADPEYNTPDRRERMLEMVFEKFEHPAAYLGRSPVLAAFSLGKSTALVLDAGAGHTSAVPIHDGYVINKGIRKTKMGGQMLDEMLDSILMTLNPKTKKATRVVPRFAVQRSARQVDGKVTAAVLNVPHTAESFYRHMRLDVLRDLKETVCRVPEEPFDLELNRNIPPIPYELPDCSTVWLGADRFVLGEKLFVPADLEVRDDFDATKGYRFPGLGRMIRESIEVCDPDMRRELFSNVVVTGGTTLFPGFPERLARDLTEECPPALKARLQLPPSKVERLYGVWVGGSILASLGSFHQMWLSKQEYEEHGPARLARKCP